MRIALVLVALCVAASAGAAAPKAGDVVYQTRFTGADPLKEWSGLTQDVTIVDGPDGGKAAQVTVPQFSGTGSRSIQTALPLDRLRGCRLRVEARVKAENVMKPANAWNGIKVMLHTVSPEGEKWDQQDNVYGTFDWKPVRFLTTVPASATTATLVLGLELATGRAWFTDVKVTVVKPPRVGPAEPVKRGPVYKGHNLPRLRGAMIGMSVGADDLRVLGGEWKANHVRWQLTWDGFPRSPADKGDLPAYDAWLGGEMKRLDTLLPVCKQLGIKVLVDLHTPPGGRDDANVCALFKEKRFQDKFLAVWDMMARRFKGNKTVWGYDLVNEPVEGDVPDGVMDWQALALETAKRVRAIDPDHAIIVEPAPWGSPDSIVNLEPLPVKGVVYSVHMYVPHQFTHQGVYDSPVGVQYPGLIAGKQWDKEQIRRALQPVLEFQRDYNVHIYIGEFSAIRWAPGAADYLRDVIDVFEENGWDWAYHAYREWSGWSVEYGSDKNDNTPAKEPTDREKLLRSWYAKNKPG